MTQERTAFSTSGFLMVIVDLALWGIGAAGTGAQNPVLAGVGFAFAAVILFGFFINQPNHSRVLVLFGKYAGTVRVNGFRWANPFTWPSRPGRDLSLRVRTFDSDVLKVNDAVGNPVEIAAVITWQVSDTGRAS